MSKDIFSGIRNRFRDNEVLKRRRATHGHQIGAWNIDIGPIEPETGLAALLYTKRQRIRIQEGHHRVTVNLRNNDLPSLIQASEAIKQLARLRSNYTSATDPTRSLKFKSDIEMLTKQLQSLGVRLPGWAKSL